MQMEIDDAGDLLFQTYYMLGWTGIKQGKSDDACLACGRAMLEVEEVRDKKGLVYTGRVCHECKRVFWIRKS
jgi:hypothetical protein